MAPGTPRSTLIVYSHKLRSKAASWVTLWYVFLLLAIWLQPPEAEVVPAAYLQGCSGHCTSHMPLVCQNQWSCDTFCSNGYFQNHGISVETRANGEQFLTRNDGASCQPRCEKVRALVCQGRVSCEKMCTFLYRGATEPAPKTPSDPTWLSLVLMRFTEGLVEIFFIADLLCSWLRLCSSYDLILQHDRTASTEPDSSASGLPRLQIDTKTFQCGLAIILRCVLECRALFGPVLVDLPILCLLLVDEVLQGDTQGLKAPQGIFVVSILGRFLRAILGRNAATSSDYSVPFATAVPSVAVPHATSPGHTGVVAPGVGFGYPATAPPASTEPIKRHGSKVD